MLVASASLELSLLLLYPQGLALQCQLRELQ